MCFKSRELSELSKYFMHTLKLTERNGFRRMTNVQRICPCIIHHLTLTFYNLTMNSNLKARMLDIDLALDLDDVTACRQALLYTTNFSYELQYTITQVLERSLKRY